MTQVKATIHKLKKFSNTERRMLEMAIQQGIAALNSDEFRQRFMWLDLTSNKGMSNATIYNMIMSGSTTLEPESDFEIDIKLEAFYSWKNTVGYTRPSTVWIWFNRRFFKSFKEWDLARNIFHEAVGHKIGFDHKSAKEFTSVPYNLGFLIEDMVREMMTIGRFLKVTEAIGTGRAKYRAS